MLGAVVVQHHHTAVGEQFTHRENVAVHMLVQMRGIDMGEAHRPVLDMVADDRAQTLHDGGQLIMERQVVGLEGTARQGRVGLLHLLGVGGVLGGGVEEIADREALTGTQPRTEEDRALAHVRAQFEQITRLGTVLLMGQEPVEEQLIGGEEPALDLGQPGGARELFGTLVCGGGSHVRSVSRRSGT